jgi:hypothetical protein
LTFGTERDIFDGNSANGKCGRSGFISEGVLLAGFPNKDGQRLRALD